MSGPASAVGIVFSSFGWVWRTPKLRMLTAISAGITLIIWLSLLGVWWSYSHGWMQSLWTQPVSWWGKGLWYMLWAVGFLVWTYLSVVLVPMVVLSVIQDPISEATEAAMQAAAPEASVGLFIRSAVRSLLLAFARILMWLVGQGLLFPLLLIPVLGAVLFSAASLLWGSFWISAEFVGAVMTRHGYRLREVFPILFQNMGSFLGLGLPLHFTVGLPVLNLITFPVAVISATRLFHELREEGKVSPPSAATAGGDRHGVVR